MSKSGSSKQKGKKKRRRSGRGFLTILLLLLIGFFGVSIYLGQVERRATEPQIRPTVLELPPAAVPGPDSPKVIIWNGCGRDGLGGRAERWLRRSGFDVFETTNGDRQDYPLTLVIARSKRTESAQEVAAFLEKWLGVGQYLEQRKDPAEAEVLLILGRDFPDSLPMERSGL